MPAPFYNCIKGTTSGTPGTGAFTPNAASSGFLAWSTVPTGWIGLVRYEDGSAWELQYSYWNGTTLSRAAASQFVASSTGSALTLTSAATAAIIADAGDIMSHVGGTPWRGWFSMPGGSTPTAVGLGTVTASGTAASVTVTATNYFTEQNRTQITSLTTANAQAGWRLSSAVAVVDTTAGRGGGEFVCRFGATALPTGPRLFVGMSDVSYNGQTIEPSALVANIAAFGLDSTDTNIQLLTNSNAGGGTKIDTGIPLAVNGWYEAAVWWEPGSNKIYGLLIRLDTGTIWFGSTTTDVPATGALMQLQALCGLNGTNTGTAAVFHIGSLTVRGGQ